jgi:hypothetical protein
MTLFNDFEPYPIKEALINAFKITSNVIFKLPKIMDIDILIDEIS